MQSFAAGGLADLFAATETVGNDQRIGRGLAHGRQQDALTYGLRNGEFFALVAERSRHSAAAGVYRFQFHIHFCEERGFVIGFYERALVAMAMEKDFARQRRRIVIGSAAAEELAEKECLGTKTRGTRVG